MSGRGFSKSWLSDPCLAKQVTEKALLGYKEQGCQTGDSCRRVGKLVFSLWESHTVRVPLFSRMFSHPDQLFLFTGAAMVDSTG